MKRFIVDNGEYKLNLYYNSLEEAKEKHPGCNIKENYNYDYLRYIEQILAMSYEKLYDNKNREILKFKKGENTIYVRLYNKDNLYLDNLSYMIENSSDFVKPITWTCCTPKEIIPLLEQKTMSFSIYSFRKYGQPKLEKPKQLKGIGQSFSVDFIKNKCKCKCFIKGDDLYIFHRDYFSEEFCGSTEDVGLSLRGLADKYNININVKNKFVYDDNWGSIVLRNEAWLVVKNIKQQFQINSKYEITQELIKLFCRTNRINRFMLDDAWSRFLEKVVCQSYSFFYIENDDNNKLYKMEGFAV